MEHETIKEWLLRTNVLWKFLYFTGCLHLNENGASSGGKWRYIIYVRRVHPVSWILMLISITISGFNRETFKDLKEDSVWW